MDLTVAPRADRDAGWTHWMTRVLVTALVVELVLGGPGYWQVADISIRRTLVLLATLWFVLLSVAGVSRLRFGHGIVMAATGALMSIWILLIPSLQGPQRLSDAIQEGFPLALVFTGVLAHAYYRDNPNAWLALRRAAGMALAAAAALAVGVWTVGTVFADEAVLVALAFISYFTLGSETLEPSLYIQVMSDGFFRVMWITSTLFIAGLLYSIRSGRHGCTALFAAALFVSYTRALWLCATIGLIYMVASGVVRGQRSPVRGRWLLALVATGAMLVTADLVRNGADAMSLAASNRLLSTFEDDSAGDRVDQFAPLVDAWLASPIFGSGMGSAAAQLRSDVAPYMYELTYVALLMKMGVVGMVAVMALLAAAWFARPRSACSMDHVDASLAAFLIACSTNPYLLNLVGLGLLCFLFIDRDVSSRPCARPVPSRQRRPQRAVVATSS